MPASLPAAGRERVESRLQMPRTGFDPTDGREADLTPRMTPRTDLTPRIVSTSRSRGVSLVKIKRWII
jgi:hypothetical protein